SIWLDPTQRVRFALGVNDLVARGELQAPVVFGYVFTDCDLPVRAAGVDAALKNPDEGNAANLLFDSLLASANGATWAAIELRNRSPRGVVAVSCAVVADGSPDANRRIRSALGGGAG